jgi:hypothetical protein
MKPQHKWLNLGLALALVMMTCLTAAVAGPAATTLAAVSPTLNQFGFPDWYQDTAGTRIEPCLDVNDPFCVVLPNPGVFDPALPMDLPANFPDEFFYSVVDSDVIATPATVALAGTAINVALPAVTLSAASVTFASQQVGTASAPVNVVVTNSGTADPHVASATLAGASPADFQGCALAVSPGASCTLQVSFAPTSGGAKTAQIRLIDDAPTSPQTVNLSGTGVSVSLSLNPTSLSFGSVGVGGSSTKSVNITNTGTANLNITSLAIGGSTTFTIANHTCGAAIAPRKSCTVNVRFAPTSRVAFTGTLNIASNATGSPHAVALTGTGK